MLLLCVFPLTAKCRPRCRQCPTDRRLTLVRKTTRKIVQVGLALEELNKRWPPKGKQERGQAACDRLVRDVLQSGHCTDNVTVILVMLSDEC